MNEKHYKKEISAYLNHELRKEERQAIGEHLLQCEGCRKEHDEIKLGAVLASHLKRADAPESAWNEIERALDGKGKTQISLIPQFSFFGSRPFVAAAALLIGFGLITVIYLGLAGNESQEIAKNEPTIQNANTELPQTVSTPNEIVSNQNANTEVSPNIQIQPQNANSNVQTLPKVNQVQPKTKPNEIVAPQNKLPSWNVETIAGNLTLAEKGKLTVGEFLETNSNSRAKIQVANIGQVEIAPNSRVQLVKTNSNEHRLSLERGILQAKILAPPRLFIVDTPSAVAVDLGCEYTLEVDAVGNSKLYVTSGFVALERDGRESIVPAGAICLTKKGRGLGTPFSGDSSIGFQNALFRFDFANGGSESLQTIIKESNFYDALTLWHLLSRTQKAERGKVFDALAA
ncbi:MAG: FecR domain-containing protein, partial [Pyrinomonadaceae bacterium]|nr:FecR domain-containing protein [Pyrinomonadaceae bacterium]